MSVRVSGRLFAARFGSFFLCLRSWLTARLACSAKGQAGNVASKSPSLPQLLAAKTAQFKHAKDLVRCPGMTDGTWTFDEFSKLVSEHAVG